jgi:hypothetical protein
MRKGSGAQNYSRLRILDIAVQKVLLSRFPEDIKSEIIVN